MTDTKLKIEDVRKNIVNEIDKHRVLDYIISKIESSIYDDIRAQEFDELRDELSCYEGALAEYHIDEDEDDIDMFYANYKNLIDISLEELALLYVNGMLDIYVDALKEVLIDNIRALINNFDIDTIYDNIKQPFHRSMPPQPVMPPNSDTDVHLPFPEND